jgi:hypothetical protein
MVPSPPPDGTWNGEYQALRAGAVPDSTCGSSASSTEFAADLATSAAQAENIRPHARGSSPTWRRSIVLQM